MDYERAGTQKEFYRETEVESVYCPLCGRDKYKGIYKERGALGIVKCLACGLIYVNPRLKNPEKVYWGDADKYFNEARLIFEGKTGHHRDRNYLEDLKLIHKFKPSGNFLDVGTNMGFFLRLARGKRWSLYGVEPSPALSELARRYFGLNVKTAYLENAIFEKDFFDIVSLTDVFEHIKQPGKLLAEVRRILKPDGILFIKVPNVHFSLLKFHAAKLFGRLKDYDLFDSYEHVAHYTHSTLCKMLEEYGFKVIKISIGKPIQTPAWHKYVGCYYTYPTPWRLDPFNQSARKIIFYLSLLEFRLRLNRVGFLAPNIKAIAKKVK